MGGGIAQNKDTKTVVVLGAAYGGARAAQILAAGLPDGWKVILIDRNSHANHVYVMPRYAVLPGHEYKAFIPYDKVFLVDPPKPEHIHLQAHVLSIRPNHVQLSRSFPELGFPVDTIAFDYAIYALGSQLPSPLNLWEPSSWKIDEDKTEPAEKNAIYTGAKTEGCAWFQEKQEVIKLAPTVLVVGGGALGIQFATDIKSVYPEKEVTLLHSRQRLLPRFDEAMHQEIRSSCETMGIKLILGERLDLSSVEKINENGQKVVKTVTGREIAADLLLLCTGQKPNTEMLKSMDPATVDNSTGLIHVLRTMQISCPKAGATTTDDSTLSEAVKGLSVNESTGSLSDKANDAETTPYPHIFAIGDAADAFGAIPAGHCAYSQGETASRNIIRLIKRNENVSDSNEPLESYTPGPPAIKVSLGLSRSVYQVGPNIGVKTDGHPDLQAAAIWPYFGIKVEKDEDMIP